MSSELLDNLRAIINSAESWEWESQAAWPLVVVGGLVGKYPIAPREVHALLMLVGELAAAGIPPSRVFDAIVKEFNVGGQPEQIGDQL